MKQKVEILKVLKLDVQQVSCKDAILEDKLNGFFSKNEIERTKQIEKMFDKKDLFFKQ